MRTEIGHGLLDPKSQRKRLEWRIYSPKTKGNEVNIPQAGRGVEW